MSPLEQAALLTKQGFRILPVINNEPREGTSGFGLATPDYTVPPVIEWWNMPGTEVGILCGPCPALGPGGDSGDQLLCIDVDGDPATHPALAAFLATLPPTLASRRGRHLWFRVPAADAGLLKTSWCFFKRPGVAHDGLDLKYNGGYARESWDWAPGVDPEALVASIATLPAAALAALLEARGARPATQNGIATLAGAPPPELERGPEALRAAGFDPDRVRQDAAAWLLSPAAPVPAEGAGSAALLVVFGALLVGFGLDDETALDLAIDVYAQRWWGDDPKGIDEDGIARKLDVIDQNGSERFTVPLELAVRARTVRDGMALTRPDAITAALAALPAAALAGGDPDGDDEDGDPAAIERAQVDAMKKIEGRLHTLNFKLQRNQKGELKNTAFNTALVLDLHPIWSGMFGYDEFTHNVVFLRDVVGAPEFRGVAAGTIFDEDHHATALQVWFGSNAAGYHEPNISSLIATVHLIAKERRFHAVRAYLDKVRAMGWDGIDRNLCNYLGAEQTPYHRAVCAKWMRSAVARAMRPGCQADNMLILEGNQGLRKSSVLKALCPDVRWFYAAASRMVGSKDFMQDMNGKWICEIPEVDQLLSSRDESEVKALLTRTTDNYRPSYARKSQDFARQLVFSGTTNVGDYLRDVTGNRRYWGVACGRINDAAVCDDRDQIWAQAVAEYDRGEWWHLTPEEVVLAEDEQEGRLQGDPWSAAVEKWLAERTGEPFSIHDVLSALPGAKPVADQTQADLNRMGKLLRKMGLQKRTTRSGGDRHKLWFPPDPAMRGPGGEPF